MKKSYLLLLLTAFSAFWGCQKDIPLVGEGASRDTNSVFIKSITLRSFPENDPSTNLPWDYGSVQPFDSTDSIGPDIYYFFYHKSDTGLIMTFKQSTHFSDVLPLAADTPLVYYFTEPFQILPEYINTTFFLRIFDLDFVGTDTSSIYMDSIPVKIGPDYTQPDPYITSITSTGLNGSHISIELEWK